ncbi:hypothetical protein PENTCL1PPCAC_28560, partial [Pristionchus entomophagus]
QMTHIVRNLDELTLLDSQSISHTSSILARLFYNLEESEGTTVDEELLNELKVIVDANKQSRIDDVAITHLAKSFLLFVDGLVARNSTVLVPSIGSHHEETSASNEDEDQTTNDNEEPPADQTAEEIDNQEEQHEHGLEQANQKVVSDEDEDVPAPMDLKIGSVPAGAIPAQQPRNFWTLIDGQYLCNNCPRCFDTQRGMLGHAKTCFKVNELHPAAHTRLPRSARKFDYAARGIRTKAASTCPYCDVEMSSVHMVEHHSRKEHMDQRTEVYGCDECGRWCCTVMALIKHWDNHGDCPNGRLIVRKPGEASAPKNRNKDEKKILFACGSCGKGFFSRLGVKYHVVNVCTQAPILDVIKLVSEGIEFISTPTPKGFNLEFVSNSKNIRPPPILMDTGSH